MLALSSCHFKEKRAKQYHDEVLQSVQAVIDNSLEYGDGIQSYEKARALQAHEKYSALVNSTFTKIETLKDFEGDTTMEHYTKELLGFYKTTLNGELQPFLQSVKAEAFSPEETLVADSLMSKLTMTESLYWERFNWAEKKFYNEESIGKVEKWLSIKLIPNPLDGFKVIVTYFFAQLADVYVNSAVAHNSIGTPNLA